LSSAAPWAHQDPRVARRALKSFRQIIHSKAWSLAGRFEVEVAWQDFAGGAGAGRRPPGCRVLAVAPDGTGLVAWSHHGWRTTTFDVAARQVGAVGPLGPVQSLHPSARGGSPRLVMEDDGGFGLVRRNNSRQGVVLSRFGPDGTPRGRRLETGGTAARGAGTF
jgi:hypothetical protein